LRVSQVEAFKRYAADNALEKGGSGIWLVRFEEEPSEIKIGGQDKTKGRFLSRDDRPLSDFLKVWFGFQTTTE